MVCNMYKIVSSVFQVPNAHIVFADDPTQESRSEDAIIAYTWEEFLHDTSDPEVVAYLPMTRAAVRAMDTMTQFTEEEFGTPVTHYTIAGGSKRGWTTWLTGAMDQERVSAIVPVVWDGINVQEVFHQQWRDYGGWSFAIEDYVENHIMPHFDTPEMVELQDLIDPFHYRTRLTMPKIAITALMDEFQMPDDEQYWWDDMPSGPTDTSAPSDGNTKWLVKSPNTEHSYVTGLAVAVPMMGTWISYLLNGWELPYLTWEYDEDTGDITVVPHGGEVYSAQMWYAESCNDERRDFRVASLDDPCECGPIIDGYCAQLQAWWYEETLEPNEDGSYTGHVEPPSDGSWRAFVVNIQMTTEHTDRDDPMHTFFTRGESIGGTTMQGYPELRYPTAPPGILEYSSRGSVVPNTYPYEDCSQETCEGELV